MCKKSSYFSMPALNIKLLQLVCLSLMSFVFIFGCKKDSDNEPKPDDFGTGYYWTTGYSDSWSDIFLGKDGNSVFFRNCNSTNLNKAASLNYTSAIVPVFTYNNTLVSPILILNDLGLPRTISVNDYDLVFCYNPDNTISLAITNSQGFVSSIRNVNSVINLTNLQSLNSSNDSREKLWTKVNLTKSIISQFNSQLYDKAPEVAGILNSALQIFDKIVILKDKTSFDIEVASTIANLFQPSELDLLIDRLEIQWNLKLNAVNIEKALKLLCIDFKSKKLSEVTNETAKYDLESYTFNPLGENMSLFDYKTGIRYCFEDGDPTQKGDELSNSFVYTTTVSTVNRSFNLKGLKSQKKYKYCAFIQYSDFVDCFEVKTFEPVYVEIISWEPTEADRVPDGTDHYLYTYSFDQEILLRGDLDFIKDLGIYSFFSNRYLSIGTFGSGSNSMWVKIQISDQDYLEYSCAPSVLFKNGQYYEGASVTRHLSYGMKNAKINENSQDNLIREMAGAYHL